MADYLVRKEKWGYILFHKPNRKYDFFYQTDDLNRYIMSNKIRESEIEFRNGYAAGGNEILSSPMAAYLEISPKCTLHCKHCFKPVNQIYSHTLSVEKIDEIIEELYRMGVFEVRLVGYEACTSPHFNHITDHIMERGFYTVLNTSAYYPEKVQRTIAEKNFDEYLVSLDGMRDTHDQIRGKGSFDRVISFINMINDRSRARLNVTVSRKNMDQLKDMAQLASDLGVSIAFSPFRNIGTGQANHWIEELTPDDMRYIQKVVASARMDHPRTRILLAYHDICGSSEFYHPVAFSVPCPARHNISILNNGQVFHCDFLAYIGDKYCGGNVLESSVYEIWNSEFMKRYENVKINQNCLQCEHYMKKCTGGCASEALETQNLFFDHLCTKYPSVTPARNFQNCSIYDEDYYLYGPDSGKSNYINYHWMPEHSGQQQKILSRFLSASADDVLVDFGAAMGYLMRAFNDKGFNMYGVDCSQYAVSRCEKYHEKLFCSNSLKVLPFDTANWVISMNALEHLSINQLLRFFQETVDLHASLFYLVPICEYDGGKYIAQRANRDVSHILRRCGTWWKTITERYFSAVTASPAEDIFGEYEPGYLCVKAVSNG